MRPLLRSDYLPARRATDLEPPSPSRCGVATLLCYVDAWISACRALLLESDYTQLYGDARLWHDPLSGRAEPFERAVARARKDAKGGRLEPFARLVAHVEETLLRADGWTPTPTEHGVLWREPDVDGTPRTLTEAAGVVMLRTLRHTQGDAPPVAVGRSVVREGYDQRHEGQGDEVAQAAAPEDDGLPGWIEAPPAASGLVAVDGDGGVQSLGLRLEREDFQDHEPSMGPRCGRGVSE